MVQEVAGQKHRIYITVTIQLQKDIRMFTFIREEIFTLKI